MRSSSTSKIRIVGPDQRGHAQQTDFVTVLAPDRIIGRVVVRVRLVFDGGGDRTLSGQSTFTSKPGVPGSDLDIVHITSFCGFWRRSRLPPDCVGLSIAQV